MISFVFLDKDGKIISEKTKVFFNCKDNKNFSHSK